MASQLAAGRPITPSCSIIGNSGVKAKRPIPIATASEILPMTAMDRGF